MCRFHSILSLLLAATTVAFSRADQVDYATQVKPLLAEKCHACHGALAQESGLRLDTRALIFEGGDSGHAIVPGDPDKSLLLERVTAEDDQRMPPSDQGSALLPDQVALLRQWIRQGASAPDEPTPPSPIEHWAFQGVTRPTIPDVRSLTNSTNPIDVLLEAKRLEKGFVTQPPAPRTILLRRLYLDLVGLPPTAEQLSDDRPYQEIVDELLASPHHGERWARHWMDVWRYSDWYGLGAQLRYSQKHLWHWRDWIVDSLNADKGYDRMIREMIAGDELAPADVDAIAGTGYLARNYYLFNRTTWLDNTIEHTGKAFLGLTLNCAKCHDHKYDPITHEDYYRFRAIFEPHQVRLDPIPGVIDFEKDGLPRVFDDHVNLATYLHRRGDPKNPDTDRVIEPGVPVVLESFAPAIEPVELPPAAYAPGSRDYVQADHLANATTGVTNAHQELADAKRTLAELPPEIPQPTNASEPFDLIEEFDRTNPDVWSVIGEGWEYRDGALHQTVSTRERQMVRLLRDLPRDFELSCRYTTTGGTTYKSVTFRFDQSEDDQHANFVYTSAHAPGPKVHVAFTRSGTTTYPPEGRKSHKIEIGRKYEIRFAVRDTLVNVWLDGKFIVAYRLPDRREGFLSLSGFDATVAFDSITIRSLDREVELTPATNQAVSSVSDAEMAVKLAEANLTAATARLRSLEATIAADDARYGFEGESESASDLARRAARLQTEAEIAAARHRVLADAADAKKLAAAKEQLASAERKLQAIDKGDFQYQSLRGAKKALETPAHKEPDYDVTYSQVSTGRRLALANWMVSAKNPLTARVAVNHVWMRHFGTPLVESVFDFGLRSKPPLHADILDLLAYEFIQSGWSFHHLHRLIVSSQTFQLASSTAGGDSATIAADPNNEYFWRMNSRRMESQVIRDSLLSLAGKLDVTIGGPSIDPSPGATRRSLYFKHSRDHQDRFLGAFDDADILQCYRRSSSIVPQQALALSNSSLSINMAADIEARLTAAPAKPRREDSASREAFIQDVFTVLLARPASDAELRECQNFFAEMAALDSQGGSDAARRARVRFVGAMLNHNDFITIR